MRKIINRLKETLSATIVVFSIVAGIGFAAVIVLWAASLVLKLTSLPLTITDVLLAMIFTLLLISKTPIDIKRMLERKSSASTKDETTREL